MAREALRRNLVVGWTVRGPDHEATIRFRSKAPRQWAHSFDPFECHGRLRVTTTSDRHRQPIANSPPAVEIVYSRSSTGRTGQAV
jgi:hypothetical protein